MPAEEIYQFKVTLIGRASVWRRFQVTGGTTLAQLHRIVQAVMGWTDSHLHRFSIFEINSFGAYQDPREDTVTIASLGFEEDVGGLGYEYDFGDRWEHEICLERILPQKPGQAYPVCLAGRCACPPEDVGGVPGYAEFLRARKNRRHPYHAYHMEWGGRRFNPAIFSVAEANGRLRNDPSIPYTGNRTAEAAPKRKRPPKPPDPQLVALARAVIAYVDEEYAEGEPDPGAPARLWKQVQAILHQLPRRLSGRSVFHQLARAARLHDEIWPWDEDAEEAYERMRDLANDLRDTVIPHPGEESQSGKKRRQIPFRNEAKSEALYE